MVNSKNIRIRGGIMPEELKAKILKAEDLID